MLNMNKGLDGDLDVLELVKGMCERWLLILACALGGVLVAAIMVMRMEPKYEVKLSIDFPARGDLAQLNVARKEAGLEPFSNVAVFKDFVADLRSESVRQTFFEERADKEAPGLPYAEFSATFSVVEEARGGYLSMTATDGRQAGVLLERFAKAAAEKTKHDLLEHHAEEIAERVGSVEKKIAVLRETARRMRDDHIVRLNESLGIARILGIDKPLLIAGGISANATGADEVAYLRGVKALEAEVKALQLRASDDAYIKELRPLEQSLSGYREQKVESAVFRPYRQNGDIEVHPKGVAKRLILLVGGVLGAAVGVLVALFAMLLRNDLSIRKHRASSEIG